MAIDNPTGLFFAFVWALTTLTPASYTAIRNSVGETDGCGVIRRQRVKYFLYHLGMSQGRGIRVLISGKWRLVMGPIIRTYFFTKV